MEQLFIPGSIIADYFYLGLFLLVAASLIAGYVDAIAGGAGLILIPAFLMVGLPPQVALAQEKLVSTIGTVAAIKNFMKSSSIVWRIVPVGIVAALGVRRCESHSDSACGNHQLHHSCVFTHRLAGNFVQRRFAEKRR